MSESDDHRKDVAGRFIQVMKAKNFQLTAEWFPEKAEEILEKAERMVDDEDAQRESVDVILKWFRSDADVEWLDRFWQTPDGNRFLELSVELVSRASFRRFAPHVPLPPPKAK